MIRSLRRRFLLIAMFSLALTLFVIGGSINLGNYIRLTDRADAIITTLYENDWNFPFVRNHPNVSGRFQLTRETEFETRYCIIHLDENEKPSDRGRVNPSVRRADRGSECEYIGTPKPDARGSRASGYGRKDRCDHRRRSGWNWSGIDDRGCYGGNADGFKTGCDHRAKAQRW